MPPFGGALYCFEYDNPPLLTLAECGSHAMGHILKWALNVRFWPPKAKKTEILGSQGAKMGENGLILDRNLPENAVTCYVHGKENGQFSEKKRAERGANKVLKRATATDGAKGEGARI